MRSVLLATLLFIAAGAIAQSDTLTASVAAYPGADARVLKGATRDLSLLDIRTASIRSAISVSSRPDSLDELLIVRDGELNLTIGDSTFTLDPGGVALLPAGTLCNLEADQASFYRFRFRSRLPAAAPIATPAATIATPASTIATSAPAGLRSGAGVKPVILRWADLPVQHTAKGESRQIFSSPTPLLSKVDIHATTLNPGEVSHPPHIHRAEEIILMRSGHAQMYIKGTRYPAGPGDLVFLPSGNPHALENHGSEPCTYFALQWER